MITMPLKKVVWLINIANIAGIMTILVMAFVFQIVFKDPPCPLCLLQRAGFVFTGLGFLLNLRFGFRPAHYSVVLVGALFTALVALRQITLHILPGTGAYGSSIFGFHMYTWSFIIAMIIIFFTSIVLGIESQYENKQEEGVYYPVVFLCFIIMFLLVLTNLVTTLIWPPLYV